jgi:hypothetical protein
MKSKILPVIVLWLLGGCYSAKMHTSYVNEPFNENNTPAPPDYADASSWAALPDKKDNADLVPAGCAIKEAQSASQADVFFIYPTLFISTPSGKNKWNADVKDGALNKKIEESTIKFQASIFNAAGRIYAPRYRQAHITAYYTGDKTSAGKAFDIAYKDVKTAFEYYLNHYNQGRPIIIASHSQGSTHGIKLLKEFFDNPEDSLGKAVSKRLVAAYLVGMDVKGGYYEMLKPCQSPEQIGCYISWRTYAVNYFPKSYKPPEELSVCVNPLTWKTDSVYAPRELNKGAVLRKFDEVVPKVSDAQVKDGVVRINKPYVRGRMFLKINNYHIADYNLFYMNVRENAVERVNAFLKRKLLKTGDK